MKIERNHHKRVRCMLISVFCLMYMVVVTNFAFASEETFSKGYEINRIANIAENLISDENMLGSIYDEKNHFIPKTKATHILIPKKGSGEIALSIGEDEICMSLPEEVAKCGGVPSKDGYIVYDSQDNVDVIIQTLEENLSSNEVRNTVRTMISIENIDAPREYYFDYNLPEGYRLVMGSELGNDEIANEAVGIINKEGYAVAIIDSPWAKDVNGEEIRTSYSIRDNTIIQTIAFDENSHFPILADPSTIVDSKIDSITYNKETDWVEVGGQPKGGYVFKTGGSVGWYYGTGESKTMSFSATLTKGILTATYKIGITENSSSGTHISVNFPPSPYAKKIIAKHNLVITEKAESYKYRITEISDNGKTKDVTYKWVTMRNWVDNITEMRPEFSLKRCD